MAEGSLHDAFIDELRDTYDAEKQLLKALPKLAKAASSPELKQAFLTHRDETQGQIERLEEVFARLFVHAAAAVSHRDFEAFGGFG